MDEKRPSLEDALLHKIKDGEGTIPEIMILMYEYNVGPRKVNRILNKYMDNNTIIWLGNRYMNKCNEK